MQTEIIKLVEMQVDCVLVCSACFVSVFSVRLAPHSSFRGVQANKKQ